MLHQLSMKRVFSKRDKQRASAARSKSVGSSSGFDPPSTFEEPPVTSRKASGKKPPSGKKATNHIRKHLLSHEGSFNTEIVDIDKLLKIIDRDETAPGSSRGPKDPKASFSFRSSIIHTDQSVVSDTNESMITLPTRNITSKHGNGLLTSLIFLSLLPSHHRSKSYGELIPETDIRVSSRDVVVSSLSSHLRMLSSEEEINAALVKRSSLPVSVDDATLMVWKSDSSLSVVDNAVKGALLKKDYRRACEMYETLRRDVMHHQPESDVIKPLLSRLVISCLMAGYEQKAEAYYLKLMKRSNGKATEMADVLILRGFLYFAFNKLDDALASWREAVYKNNCDNTHAALLWNNVACLQTQLGRNEEACDSLNQSIAIQTRELKDARDTNQALLNISITKSNLAVIAEIQKDYGKAVDQLEESLLLQESILEERNLILDKTKEHLHRVQRLQQSSPPTRSSASILDERKQPLFGEGGGLPLPRETAGVGGAADLIHLGPLMNEHSPDERVQESFAEDFNFLQNSDESSLSHTKRASLPIDVDRNRIKNAKMKLSDIYQDVTYHLMRKEIHEALKLLKYCLRSHRGKYGGSHPLVASTLHNIGIVLLFVNRYGDALAYFQHAAAIRIGTLGIDHLETCASLMKVGLIQVSRRDFDDALATLSQILHSRRRIFGYLDPRLASVLNNIACVHFECGGLVAATKSLEEALEVLHKSGTKTSGALKATATLLCNQGFVLSKRGRYEDSLAAYVTASEMQKSVYPAGHPALVTTVENIESVMAQIRESRKVGESFLDLMSCGPIYQQANLPQGFEKLTSANLFGLTKIVSVDNLQENLVEALLHMKIPHTFAAMNQKVPKLVDPA